MASSCMSMQSTHSYHLHQNVPLSTEEIAFREVVGQINECFKHNKSALIIFNQHLTSVPSDIGKLKELKSLTIIGGEFQVLPPEIGNLDKLETLRVEGGALKTLPKELGKLKQLTILELRGNNITRLPEELLKANVLVYF